MSSLLKRLRETAEMRELGIDDRQKYRGVKWLAKSEYRARQAFRRRLDASLHNARDSTQKKAAEENHKRSLLALKKGVTLKSVFEALKFW